MLIYNYKYVKINYKNIYIYILSILYNLLYIVKFQIIEYLRIYNHFYNFVNNYLCHNIDLIRE